MKESSRKALKIIASILLAVCVLSCSFSVFASDPSPSPTPELDDGLGNALTNQYLYAMWLTLQAWGIDITLAETEEFSEEVGAWIYGQVLDFLSEIPSVSTWGQWVSPWFLAVNEWGIFEGNSTYVEDMQDFVDWLVEKLGLSDNQQTQITLYTYIPVIDKDDEPVYLAVQIQDYGGTWVPKYNTNTMYNVLDEFNGFIKGDVYYLSSGYYFRYRDYNSSLYVFEFAFDEQFNQIDKSFNQGKEYGDNKYDNPYYDGYNYRWGNGQAYVFYNPNITNNHNGHYGLFTGAMFQRYNNVITLTGGESMDDTNFLKYFMPQSHGYDITTGVIELPDDNGWQDGYSIQIEDGESIYVEINWPDSISVDNLPAVIQPANVKNPEIDQFYDFIPSFIEEAGNSMNFFKQIIFRMPDEVLYCIYAVLAAGVIFGFLRILREH